VTTKDYGTKKQWGTSYKLDFNLDQALIWARKLQLSKPAEKDWLLSNDQIYWEGKCPNNLWSYLNTIVPLDGDFRDKGPNYCTLQEYPSCKILSPHIDPTELYEATFLLPLIGKATTSIVEPDTANKIDSITYGPGEGFWLKNGEYWHMVEPIDEYRLVVMFFIIKGTDLDSI